MKFLTKLLGGTNTNHKKEVNPEKEMYRELDRRVFKHLAKLDKSERRFILFSEFPEGSENIAPLYNLGYSEEVKSFALTKIINQNQKGYELFH